MQVSPVLAGAPVNVTALVPVAHRLRVTEIADVLVLDPHTGERLLERRLREAGAAGEREVADVDAVYAELAARGIPFQVPPEDFPARSPTLRIAFFTETGLPIWIAEASVGLAVIGLNSRKPVL